MLLAACAGESAEIPDGNPSRTPSGTSGHNKEPGGPGSSTLSPDALTPTDIAVLLPIQDGLAPNRLLQPQSRGTHGVLLPESLRLALESQAKTHTLDQTLLTPEASRAGMRLVGIRVDPCFLVLQSKTVPKGARVSQLPGTCRPQIRVIFQSLFESAQGGMQVGDGAMHVFYNISSDEALVFAEASRRLRVASGDPATATLGVHPSARREGLSGPFATGIQQELLKYVGAARIDRATTFARLSPTRGEVGFIDWNFAIVAPDGTATSIGPNGDSTHLQFFQAVDDTSENNGGSTPPIGRGYGTVPSADDHLDGSEGSTDLGDHGAGTTGNATSPSDNWLSTTRRIENPDSHTAESTDCVSCHIAEASGAAAERAGGKSTEGFLLPALVHKDSPTPGSFTNLHAFSYFRSSATINRRTQNEVSSALATLRLARERDAK